MATQTLTTFDALLKNVYRGPIVELLNQETYLIDQVEKSNVNELGAFSGRQLVFPVHTARNRGRGATTDGGGLATAGSQSYLDGIVSIKYFNQGIELSDMVIKQSETDEGAFVRALTSEMEGAMTDLRKDIARMCYGTGDGLLATVTGTPNGTSITVDSGQYIAVGDYIDILVKSSGATTNGVVNTQVTGVAFTGTAGSSTQANATLTIANATAGALSNTYGVYLTGDRANESDGLRNITSTGRTLHQINSSTYPVWDGNTKSAGNANPSEDLFMQIAQTIRQRSGKSIDCFLTTLGVQRRLANTYASQKRWNDSNVTKVDGGYSAIMVAAGNDPVPVISDVDCVNGYAFALNKGSFAWAEVAKPDWLEAPDGKGSILHLKDGSSAGSKIAVWQAWIAWYSTLVNVAPLRNGQISGLNDDLPINRL
jgi:hypothetical protein